MNFEDGNMAVQHYQYQDAKASPELVQSMLRSGASGNGLTLTLSLAPTNASFLRTKVVGKIVENAKAAAAAAAAALGPEGKFRIEERNNPDGSAMTDYYVKVVIPRPESGEAFAEHEKAFYKALRQHRSLLAPRVAVLLDFD